MRNPNGYGSVYKLSGNRRNPWAARATLGVKDNGQGLYKFVGYYPTRAEAMLALADYNKSPYDIDMRKYTLTDVWQIFKERNLGDGVSKSKRNVYNVAWKHLAPLAKMQMNAIKTYQMQMVMDGISCKWQTKSHVKTLLNQLFNIALELDVCNKNYAEFVKIGEKKASDIHRAFTQEEIDELFKNILADECIALALILIYTGMRPTELLEMKIADVDLKARIMRGGIKTNAGKNRLIPINAKILPLVKHLYDKNKEYLVERNGKKVSYDAFKSHWDKAIPNHLPHDGRHTFASLMDTAGANKLAIKRIMGHASADITDKVYTHKQADELIKCVDLI